MPVVSVDKKTEQNTGQNNQGRAESVALQAGKLDLNKTPAAPAESIATKRGLDFYKSAPPSPKPSAPPGNITVPEKSLTPSASKYITGNLNNSAELSMAQTSAPSAPTKYITGNLNNSAPANDPTA